MIKIASLAYLIFPVVIFFLNWTNLAWQSFEIPTVIFAFLKISKQYRTIPFKKFSSAEFATMFLVAFVWIWLSGIGGYAFQNWDFQFRNAVLHDLIDFAWPVHYNSEHILTYYFTFWLPSALIGKLMGWHSACSCLFCWSLIGILLTFLLASNISKIRASHLAVFFILFSGMDILGYFFEGLCWDRQFFPKLGGHIENWAERLIQYSSFTTQLYWVFNQAIPTWIACMLLLDEKEPFIVLTIWALILPYSPFCFIGATPFIVIRLLMKNNKFRPIAWKNAITFWRLLSLSFTPTVIAMACGLFFLTSNGVGNPVFLFEKNSIHRAALYLLFCAVEFGIYVAIAHTNRIQRQLDFYVATGTLLAIPWIMIGRSNDFCMRASIPALVFLFMNLIYVLKSEGFGIRKKVALFACLTIGAITPFQEIYRSLHYGASVSDDLKSFQSGRPRFGMEPYISNFVSMPVPNTAYQKWVAPR